MSKGSARRDYPGKSDPVMRSKVWRAILIAYGIAVALLIAVVMS